ncbi:MAG: NAD(P)-binding domain-containing protein [Planctomycetota bacterium]|nr:NAD(P)-binding domain-containing protein [Planctomycetota bacterium]
MGITRTGTVSVLGVGRIGSALVQAFLSRGILRKKQIIGTHHDLRRARRIRRALGITVVTDNRAAVARSNVVLLCVRPQQISSLLEKMADSILPRHTVVSVAVGVPLSWLKKRLPRCGGLFHVHPPSQLTTGAAGISFLAHPRGSPAASLRQVTNLFRGLGPVVCVPEKQIDACAVFAGCGPAFWAHLGLTWAKLCGRFGIPPSIARQIVAATLSGLARGTEGGTANLERLIENVATPGGITEAGIRFLDKARVEDILNAMVAHCLARIVSIRGQFKSASMAK